MNTPEYVGVDNHISFQSAVYLIFRTYIGSDSKEFTYNAGDSSSIPGPGRSCGEGNSNPLQYSCLGNPIDRGVSKGIDKSQSHWVTNTYLLKGILLI